MLANGTTANFARIIDLILVENINNHFFNYLGAIYFLPILINLIYYRFFSFFPANNPRPHMYHHAPL